MSQFILFFLLNDEWIKILVAEGPWDSPSQIGTVVILDYPNIFGDKYYFLSF